MNGKSVNIDRKSVIGKTVMSRSITEAESVKNERTHAVCSLVVKKLIQLVFGFGSILIDLNCPLKLLLMYCANVLVLLKISDWLYANGVISISG